MFVSDNAITNEKDDLLNRARFANKLGEQIINLGTKESKVIAVYGDWGKGKTSILNIAIARIEEMTKNGRKLSAQ